MKLKQHVAALFVVSMLTAVADVRGDDGPKLVMTSTLDDGSGRETIAGCRENFTCTAKYSRPALEINWYNFGVKITESWLTKQGSKGKITSSNTEHSGKGFESTSILSMILVSSAAGTYSCRTNGTYQLEKEVLLRVVEEPAGGDCSNSGGNCSINQDCKDSKCQCQTDCPWSDTLGYCACRVGGQNNCKKLLTSTTDVVNFETTHLEITDITAVAPTPMPECPDYKFGVNCTQTCHCKNTSEVCDKHSGRCSSGCLRGWKESDCQQPDCSHSAYCGIHSCHELRHDYSCSCLDGYENSDSHHCEDIDECQQDYICDSHTCHNGDGSFSCICNSKSYANVDKHLCLLIIPDSDGLNYVFLVEDIKVLVVEVGFCIHITLFIVISMLLCARTVVRSVYRYVTTEPRNLYIRQVYICPFNSIVYIDGNLESEFNSDDSSTDDIVCKIHNSAKSICNTGSVSRSSRASRTSRASQATAASYKSCLECECITSTGCRRCGAVVKPSGSVEFLPGFGSCGICGRVINPSD